MNLRGLFGALLAAAALFAILFFAASLLIALAIAIPVLLLLGALFGRRPTIYVYRPAQRPQPQPQGPVIDHEP